MTNSAFQKPCVQAVLAQPVLLLDGQDIDLTSLHQFRPKDYPFILESVAKTEEGGLGQFSIALGYPQESIQLNPNEDTQHFVEQAQAAFGGEKIQQVIEPQALETLPAGQLSRVMKSLAHIPFKGGWFAYFSYDYAQVVEPVLDLPASKFPLANLTRTPAGMVVDHQNQVVWALVESQFSKDNPLVFPKLLADIERSLVTEPEKAATVPIVSQIEEPEEKYLNGVKAIKEYILAGDVFQVNLSRLWKVAIAEHENYLSAYRALCQHNPAPFAALCCLHDEQGESWQILSSSPERLAKFDGTWVDTRPIAGTRRRSKDEAADQALMAELIAHPKERAEHIMLIDLERNDLGRICQPGSVEVNELMVIESYEHVHHIVSNVRGKLRDGFSPLDMVHALFPGGTITGCPKIRCMEIVAELEQMPREAYTGSLGYINLDGTMDLNILIRTMIANQPAGQNTQLQFRAGAGIVADSDPEFELVETRHKARGLLRALGDSDA